MKIGFSRHFGVGVHKQRSQRRVTLTGQGSHRAPVVNRMLGLRQMLFKVQRNVWKLARACARTKDVLTAFRYTDGSAISRSSN
jgi:hypothetical protein